MEITKLAQFWHLHPVDLPAGCVAIEGRYGSMQARSFDADLHS